MNDNSLTISPGTFALETASLSSEVDENIFTVVRDVFPLHFGQLAFELTLDPKFLPHSHLSITQLPCMDQDERRGTRG